MGERSGPSGANSPVRSGAREGAAGRKPLAVIPRCHTNAKYQRNYYVPEKETTLEAELARYLEADELRGLLTSRNKATQLMANQSRAVKALFQRGDIVINFFSMIEVELREMLGDTDLPPLLRPKNNIIL